MFDWFKKKKVVQPEPAPRAEPRAKKIEKTAKELATEADEPYITVLRMDVDPENLHQGAFELDWNEKFVSNLVRAGYMISKDDTDAEIVDRWFQNVCRHVVMETWEQEQAIIKGNAPGWVRTTDLGNGKSEVR
jgi:hypothetical protein